MSLYNYLFGKNEKTKEILNLINLCEENFERFRDVNLKENGTIVDVLTRTGGHNREDYNGFWAFMRFTKCYLTDYDDEFDETYAHIEFKVPENHLEEAKALYTGEPQTFKEKFMNELNEMDKDGTPANEKAKAIAENFKQAADDPNIKFITF